MKKFIGLSFSLATLLVLLVLVKPTPIFGAPPEEEPTPKPVVIDPRMAKPIVPENARLAEKGELIYWQFCLACHGDKGQGLTEEFRSMAYQDDMNCWQSKCHALNHPPEGFEIPKIIPPVVGSNTLNRFVTARDLFLYVQAKMPWYKTYRPFYISPEDYWAVTAYLLRENGVLSPAAELYPQEASILPVHMPIRSHNEERIIQIVLVGSLGLLIIGSMVSRRFKIRLADTAVKPASSRPNFLYHLHPPTIPLLQARWRYTLGMGGLAIFLTLAIVLSGILEMFFYIPTPEQAGLSVQTISYMIPYGGLVRGIHFWAAQALVVVAAIHLLRVIFTGAYSGSRRLNYLIGLGLFVVALLMDFTGYILRWDEGIHWALTVGANLLKTFPWIGTQFYGFIVGGNQPGPATLIRFYAWHIFGLTAILIVILTWHIFRVRRDGGISTPPPDLRTDNRRISRIDLARREVLAMLVATIVLIIVAALIPAPIAVPIQDVTTIVQKEVRAPWFFLWVQQLLRYGDAFWLGIALPLGFLAILIAIPFFTPRLPDEQLGRWFPRAGRVAQVIATILALAWIILTVLELGSR